MIISPSNRIEKVKTYYFATKLKEVAELNAQGKDIINLGIGSPDLDPHPDIVSAMVADADAPGAHRYQSYSGIESLRASFAEFYKRHFDVILNHKSEIYPLIGSKEGIMHLSMAFLDPGDKVLVPDPGYPTYTSATRLAGGEIVPYSLTEDKNWLPDLEQLSNQDLSRVKMMWVNYPHMPTGQKATLQIFEELIAFGKKNKILICHDNPYSFILNDEPLSIMQISGAKECAIELFSLSKSFNMAGWRIGALISSNSIREAVQRFKSNMDSGMFRPLQKAGEAALNLGNEWFKQINNEYQERRKIIWEIMDLLDVEFDKNAVGMFVWGRPRSHQNVEELTDDILYGARVFITPGFIFGKNGKPYLRLSLCADQGKIIEAKDRIEKWLGKSNKSPS